MFGFKPITYQCHRGWKYLFGINNPPLPQMFLLSSTRGVWNGVVHSNHYLQITFYIYLWLLLVLHFNIIQLVPVILEFTNYHWYIPRKPQFVITNPRSNLTSIKTLHQKHLFIHLHITLILAFFFLLFAFSQFWIFFYKFLLPATNSNEFGSNKIATYPFYFPQRCTTLKLLSRLIFRHLKMFLT